MTVENWRLCYHDRYEVSDMGRVRNAVTQQVLRPGAQSRGYLTVSLYDGSSPKRPRSITVHRLVTAAFLGPSDKAEINHINGVKSDNRLANLEYATSKENHAHARDVLGVGLGMKNGRAKLTDEQVAAIIASDETHAALGRQYGISATHIRHLRLGKYRRTK